MTESMGTEALRTEIVDGVVKGWAARAYKFKQAVAVASTSAWKNTFFRETSTPLTEPVGNAVKGYDLSKIACVFGGKRPALFLRRAISKKLKKSFLPPKIFSIDEFIEHINKQSHNRTRNPIPNSHTNFLQPVLNLYHQD